MAFLSRDEFLAQQAQREVNRQAFPDRPKVGFFSLKNDGDEAVVRFAYSSPEEFEVYTVHPVSIEGKFRKVNCINDLRAGIHNCPLCEAGIQLQNKFYIKLIEYVRDENNNIVPQARIWERPTSYLQRLTNLFTEYGDLRNCVFKIKRNGEKGSMKTDYSFMFGNPTIYNDNLYVKDFSEFDNYSVIGSAILDYDESKLRELLGSGSATPAPTVAPQPQQQYQMPQPQQQYQMFTPAAATTVQPTPVMQTNYVREDTVTQPQFNQAPRKVSYNG